MAEIAALPTSGLFEQTMANNRIYNLPAQLAMRSIEAEDMFNATPYNEYTDNTARQAFDEKWNKLYPKSGQIRKRIIEANRISMDNVTPKAGWTEKINFSRTLGEYKADYPKTFYTRYWLIMNSQIKEGSVTSKVKSWYKRFFYKKLLKGSFGFKK